MEGKKRGVRALCRAGLLLALILSALFALTGCGQQAEVTEAVFGSECAGYKGFQYLKEQTVYVGYDEDLHSLTRKKARKVTVFVPGTEEERVTADYNEAFGEQSGVSVRIQFLPYTCAKWEEMGLGAGYEPEMLLEYPKEYTNVETSPVQRIDGGAHTSAGFGQYDRDARAGYYTYREYYMFDFDENTCVALTFSIRSDRITRESEALLSELEEFYCIDIDWDRDRAWQKAEEIANIDWTDLRKKDYDEYQFNCEFMVFDMDSGWEEVELSKAKLSERGILMPDLSEIHNCHIYASDINEYIVTGLIAKAEDSVSPDVLPEKPEMAKWYLEKLNWPDNVIPGSEKPDAKDIWIERQLWDEEKYGKPCLGRTIEVYMTFHEEDAEDEDSYGWLHLYLAEDGDIIYLIAVYDPTYNQTEHTFERNFREARKIGGVSIQEAEPEAEESGETDTETIINMEGET